MQDPLGKYQNNLSFKNKLGRFLWNICYILFFKYFSLPLFNKWRIFVLRCFGAKIGERCKINSSVRIWAPWNLEIGTRSAIGFDVLCYNPGRIILGDCVSISQRVHLCSASHDFTLESHPLIVKPIIIENSVWVATDVFVAMGVTLGEGGVIGARASVFKNTKPWTVYGGNPAKALNDRVMKS